jgi:hypothetical protein
MSSSRDARTLVSVRRERLAEVVRQRGMGIGRLSILAGITPSALRRMLRGERVQRLTVRAIADYLQVDADELIAQEVPD